MKNFVVTGGAGFIGSHLVEKLVDSGNKVAVIDCRKDLSNLSHLLDRIEVIDSDLANFESIDPQVFVNSTVYHLAAFAKPSVAETQPLDCYSDNVLGAFKLLKTLSEFKPKRIISISAGALYSVSAEPYSELSSIDPLFGVYSSSKRIMELMLKDFERIYGVRSVVVRLFNTYGPRQELDYLIPSLIVKAKKGDFEIYNGSVVRDFNHVEDVVNALTLLNDYQGDQELFNIGTGKGTSIAAIAEIISDHFKVGFKDLGRESFGPAYQVVNSKLLSNETGWTPNISVGKGVNEFCQYLSKNISI
jgi:UDP-glucose 4-epimerase